MLKKLTRAEYEDLTREGDVLERDAFGIKVMLLPQKRILKLFRRKRLLSSQIWITHAVRFDRNAAKLRRRKVPTIKVQSVFHIPTLERSAVVYELLEGCTLRDWLATREAAQQKTKLLELGTFVAQLHAKGILFRSLHLGNVIVMDEGAFGLIDIADVGFSAFGSLSISQRIRNFHHMDRHPKDRNYLASQGGQNFMGAYIAEACLSGNANLRLNRAFKDIFVK